MHTLIGPCRTRFAIRSIALATTLMAAQLAHAIDIAGVESAALDQPRINAYVSNTAGGAPLVASDAGIDAFNIQAYYDTGASGVLLSTNTAALLGIGTATFNGQDVIYSDVGVGGSDQFYVSNPIHIALADYHPNRDVDNLSTYQSVYTNHFGPIRAQVGPAFSDPDPALGDLDVFGMPTMAGKVVVMDPKPVNSFLDTMRTYVYAPGTPYNAAQASTNPGIPTVEKHVKLSYVNFDRFTQVTPTGAPGPSLRNNPFIGPNPFVTPGTDTTPPVKLAFEGATTTGSFLLDTGAAASIISKNKAGALGVSYDPNTVGTDNPVLMYGGHPITDQFQLTIGGIGGSKVVSGFYLDSLLLKTDEGNAADDNDPNHIRFTRAPVLVSDISVANPNNSGDTYTLDGIFGMNYLVASAQLLGVDASGLPLIGNLVRGKFDWVTFDEPNGRLGLSLAPPAPQGQLEWFGDLSNPAQSHWDLDSANWIGADSFAIYEDGDQVHFGDSSFSPTIRLNEVVAPGGVTFDNSNDPDGQYGLDYDLVGTGKITGLGGLNKRGTAELRIWTSNDYKGATVVEAGSVIFYAGQNVGPLTVRAGASVLFASTQTQRFDAISVEGNVTVSGAPRIVTRSIGVATGGQFDIGDAKLIVGDAEGDLASAGATARALRDALGAGYHNGAWDGSGLVSALAASDAHLAIGYIEAATKFGTTPATWNGESVTDGQVLVAVTRRGDANLDLTVNFADLLALAQNYGKTDRVWSNGDFTYDGVVNFADLLSLAQNYGGSRLSDAAAIGIGGSAFASDWALAQSLLPEPTAIAATIGMVSLASRRRRSAR